MKRRDFLVGTAAGASAFIGLNRAGHAQAPAGTPQAGRGAGGPAPGPGARWGAGRGGPASVPPEKLARVSMMVLNWAQSLYVPGQEKTPERTLDLFDVPEMVSDVYGVHNIEIQHQHLALAEEKDPGLLKQFKAKTDAVKTKIIQINLEFGPQGVCAEPALRQQAIDRTRRWTDMAVELGCERVMINQQQAMLNAKTMPDAIAALKTMVAYATPRGVMVTAETRGGGPSGWLLMKELLEGGGGFASTDIGNAQVTSQQALHDVLKGMMHINSGDMHIKNTPFYDIGTAIRYSELLGYKGVYAVEIAANSHPAVRIVYDTILANL